MAKFIKEKLMFEKCLKKDHMLPLTEAIIFIKENANANFDETIDIVIDLNLDLRKNEKNIRFRRK